MGGGLGPHPDRRAHRGRRAGWYAGQLALPPDVLGSALAGDTILLDASKPYSNAGYLHRELVLFGVIPEEGSTSGGRSLTQNVVDLTLSALVGTVPLGSEWDCVEANDNAFPEGWPYLADPN